MYSSPPWTIPTIESNISLLNYRKGKSNASKLKSLVPELEETFPNHIHKCTDGSRTPNGSEYAVNGSIPNNSNKLHPKTPILHCELISIKHAVHLTSIDQTKNYTSYCDSINADSSFQNLWTNDPLIQECKELYIKPTNRKNTVTVTLISAYIGNILNERSD